MTKVEQKKKMEQKNSMVEKTRMHRNAKDEKP